jgi:hypothetical protein
MDRHALPLAGFTAGGDLHPAPKELEAAEHSGGPKALSKAAAMRPAGGIRRAGSDPGAVAG